MILFRLIVSLLLLILASERTCELQYEFQDISNLMVPKIEIKIQTHAALDVISRIVPNDKKKFQVHIDPSIRVKQKDVFKLTTVPDKNILLITATSGVAATWGFHHYLKYYCNSHVSWEANQIQIPKILPQVNITITANDWIRYYQNVCTTSYSFVWWNWSDWEKHTDWIALNGFNLVLTFNGQEAIWERVYKRLTLTQKEIDEHFSGPAFLSWQRMGNIRGFGGPLSEHWHNRSRSLQKMILNKLRNLGIKSVLPAFAGHVPRAIKRIYPNENLTTMKSWNGFEDKYCCPYLLDPTSTLFKKIGIVFLQEQTEEFGTDHFYNCDTFNEMTPPSNNLTYLNNIGKSIYASMTVVDPRAIWVLQGWVFVNEANFWKINESRAFLNSIPSGKMLVLDLQSEQFPQYGRLQSYFGQPFVWNMLHNFGGTLGLFGSLDIINEEVFVAREFEKSTMIGTGITPEGINQNYVMYDFMLEMGWRNNSTDVNMWIQQYVYRRYGQQNKNAVDAWLALRNTVYNYKGTNRMRGKYAFNRRPSLNIKLWIWYEFEELFNAWQLLLKASDALKESPTYLHDLVDVTRQVLQVLGDKYYNLIVKSYYTKEKNIFSHSVKNFLIMFDEMDKILMSNEAFLLGKWLSSAKAAASSKSEEKQFEYNARNQITLWGPNGEILDYANKQWAGVVSNYFKPRWETFLTYLNTSLINGTPFKEREVGKIIFKDVEKPFTFSQSNFTDVPIGDSVEIAKSIFNKMILLNRTSTIIEYNKLVNKKWKKLSRNLRRKYLSIKTKLDLHNSYN